MTTVKLVLSSILNVSGKIGVKCVKFIAAENEHEIL